MEIPKSTGRLIFAGALIVTSLLLAPEGVSQSQAASEVRVLTWENYVKDDWVKMFEDEYDVVVKKTFVGSNDEYMAKLAAGGSEYYDVVTIVSSLAQPAIRAGFVEPVDKSLIPELANVFEAIRSNSILEDKDGNLYGVAFVWGTDPVTVNSEKIPEGNDFGILFDSKYKGRIAMWDDISTMGDVANWMGIDKIWDMTDEQLERVKAKMCEQKPLVRKYWSAPGEGVELFASGEVWASHSFNYITQALQNQGFPAREFVPQPPIGWIDNNFVVKGAKNREMANRFLNFMISAKVQAMVAEDSGYSVVNPQSKEFMKPKIWTQLYMDEGPQMLKRMKFWDEIPRRDKYLEVWNEIKACGQ